jgi:hypothetical protein
MITRRMLKNGAVCTAGLIFAGLLVEEYFEVKAQKPVAAGTSSSQKTSAPREKPNPKKWVNKRLLTIDHSKVSGSSNLTNFPMLVALTDPSFKSTGNGGGVGKNDGTDIFFTANDGVTRLNHEIES